MSITVDAQGTKFECDGVEVGGIQRYVFDDANTPDATHQSLGSNQSVSLPGKVPNSLFTLVLYRNTNDPGQIRLEQARVNRQIRPCKITLKDGTTRSFLGYVKQLPIVGSIQGADSLATANCLIRASGAVT